GEEGHPKEARRFHTPPSEEPSRVRESNRRTDRERALHGPWSSWSSRAISFPAPTSSNVGLSEAWQSPISQRGARLKATSRSKTGKHGYALRSKSYFRKLPRGRPTHALMPRSAFEEISRDTLWNSS